MTADLVRWKGLLLAEAPWNVGLRELHQASQRLRRLIVPGLSVRQVLALDALLDRPAWADPGRCTHVLRQGFVQGLSGGNCLADTGRGALAA